MNQVLKEPRAQVFMVGNNHLSAQLLSDLILSKLSVTSASISVSRAVANTDGMQSSVFIVDCEQLPSYKIDQLIQTYSQGGFKTKIILINTNHTNANSEWVRWPSVYGFIPTGVGSQKIIDAIQQVMAGDLWIPRNILNQFFRDHRRIPLEKDKLYEELTKRELEILRMAAEGCTNPEIANRLSVSINTVKSHLHNLFKKLSVKNRIQAIEWVKSHEA